MGEPTVQEPERNLLLDELSERLDALRVLRADDPEAANRMLADLGARGKAEADIMFQLGATRPLWRPDRFEDAHRLLMRALEVLDRNGARPARLPRLGPLTPVAAWAVQLVTRWIVKNHQNRVIDHVKRLYERREANSHWGSTEMHLLRRARLHAERVQPGLKARPLGLPTFLVGGAFVSSILSLLRGVGDAVSRNVLFIVIGAVFLALVFAALSWVVLYSAAIARRRIALTLDAPVRSLYETIGACGEPPRDDSRTFAVLAIVFTALGWIVAPVGVVIALFS